jgi:Tfp pilus assembly protein PilX
MSRLEQRRPGRQSGSVLVLALLVTLVILGVGLVAMWLSSSGMKMSGNITRRQEAMYAAEAGLEHARAILQTNNAWGPLISTPCLSGEPPNDYTGGKGPVLCDGATALYNYSLLQGSSTTLSKAQLQSKLTYTVFIRNDPEEVQSTLGSASPVSQWDDQDSRVVVRSEGRGRDGLSFFAVETVISRAAASLADESYSQLGGSAQNRNSDEGKLALPTP